MTKLEKELRELNPGFSFLQLEHIVKYTGKSEDVILAVLKDRIRPTNKILYYIPELCPIVKDIMAGKFDNILDKKEEEE